jgi:hydrogenase maturation protease
LEGWKVGIQPSNYFHIIMKTLIIGLGNPILGDDGIGWCVAEEITALVKDQPEVDVDCFSLGGLSLMERITGYEKVIIIDAFQGGTNPVGQVEVFSLGELPDVSAGHTTSAHDTSLKNALSVGRGLNVPLPENENIFVVAVETKKVYDFSKDLSSQVAAAVPRAVEAVLGLINTHKKGV